MFELDNGIIKDLYSTDWSVEKWQSILDRLHPIVNARSAGLVVIENFSDGNERYQLGVTSTSLNPEMVGIYNHEFAKYEHAMVEASLQHPPGTMLVDPAFCNKKKISNRPDVAFAMKHFGILDRFGVRLNDDGAWHDAIAFQYAVEYEKPIEREFLVLKPYLPHLAQAISLGRMYDQIRRRYNAVLSMLDRVGVGMVLLKSDSSVVICNQFAKRVIDNSSHLTISPSGRMISYGSKRDELKRCINQSSLTNRTTLHSKRYVTLGSDLDDDYILIELSPLRDHESEVGIGLDGVLAIILDPNRPTPQINKGALKSLYNLTAAETAVAGLIGDGCRYKDIAERRGTSSETIKTQMRSLFMKMRAKTRAGIIRRVLAISLPFYDS